MSWAALAMEIGIALARKVFEAMQAGDASILDKPVRELLGAELATTLAKKIADAKAEAKFGSGE